MSSMWIGEWTQTWAEQKNIFVSFFDEIPSTNDLAKLKASSETHPLHLYLANHQSRGRGRGQNIWLSPEPGHGLLSTWSLDLNAAPAHTLSPRCGLLLLKAAQECWPSLTWSLKAPNDLYLGQKKIAGLLIECISQGPRHRLLFGLGMNVGSVPPDMQEATCLMSEEGLGSDLMADLSQDRWFQFLDLLWQNILSLQNDSAKQLSESERQALLQSLNANPYKPGLLIDVTAEGDLVTEKQKISWMDL